jgi:hypothetical protein
VVGNYRLAPPHALDDPARQDIEEQRLRALFLDAQFHQDRLLAVVQPLSPSTSQQRRDGHWARRFASSRALRSISKARDWIKGKGLGDLLPLSAVLEVQRPNRFLLIAEVRLWHNPDVPSR